MPNKNYLAGRRCEWAVCKFYREMGWEAVRTAGSKGLVDVVAWKPGGLIHLVQVKRSKRGGKSWQDANWKALGRRGPAATWLCWGCRSASPACRVYAFVYRHGKRAPEIYDLDGTREWVA